MARVVHPKSRLIKQTFYEFRLAARNRLLQCGYPEVSRCLQPCSLFEEILHDLDSSGAYGVHQRRHAINVLRVDRQIFFNQVLNE